MSEDINFEEKMLQEIKEHEEIYERALSVIRRCNQDLRKYYIDRIRDIVKESGTVSDGWASIQNMQFILKHIGIYGGQDIMITEIRVNLDSDESEYDYVYSHNGSRSVPKDFTVPLSKMNADWKKMKELLEYIKGLKKSEI